MQLLFPNEFDFYPETWFLPEQYHQFVAEASMKNKTKQVSTFNASAASGRISSRSSSRERKRNFLVVSVFAENRDVVYSF